MKMDDESMKVRDDDATYLPQRPLLHGTHRDLWAQCWKTLDVLLDVTW
jgi:hypothetical protein